MAEYLPPVVAQLTGDISDFLAKMAEAQEIIDSLDGTDIALSANADDVLTNVEVAQGAIDALEGNDVPLSADLVPLLADLEVAQEAIDSLSDDTGEIHIPLDVNPAEAIAAVKAVEAEIEGIDTLMPWVDVQAQLNQTSLAIMAAELAVATAERTVEVQTQLIDASAEVAIAELDASIEALSQVDPVVDINTALAELQIAGLKAELEALATTVPVTVAETGGIGGGGGGGAIAVSGSASESGGGGTTGGSGGFWSTTLGTLLGGSGAGFSKGTLGFGAPLLPTIPLAGFGTLGSLAGLGPESLLGLLAGVGGSAAGAVAGAGALTLGAAGVAGVGMGTDMAGIGQAMGDVQKYNTALQQLNQTIAEYGAGSSEATAAQNNLNYTLAGMPTAAQSAIVALGSTLTQWTTLFDQATGVAEAKGAAILQSLIQTGESFLPTIGQFASQNMTIIQTSLQPLLTWIKGPGLQVFTELEQIFQEHLPTAMHAFDQGVELLVKVIGYIAPETGNVITWLNNLFTKLNGPEFGKVTHGIQDAINIFHTWWGLIKNVGDAIYELFKNDAGTGTAVIKMLSNLVKEFDNWAKTVAGGDKLHDYMEAHRQEILQLIQIIGKLIGSFGELHLSVGTALMTIVGDFLKFVNVLLKNPIVSEIASYGAAFLLLAHHISPLWSIVTKVGGALGNLVKNLAISAINAFGGAISNLGGPFGKIGGWLQNLGQTGPSVEESMQAAAASMQEASAAMQEAAEAMQEAMAAVAGSATEMSAAVDPMVASIGASMGASAEQVSVAADAIDADIQTMVGSMGASAAEASGAMEAMSAEVSASLGEVGIAADAMGVEADAAAGGIDILDGAMDLLSSAGLLIVVAGVYELIKHFGVLHGLMIAGALAVLGLAAAFIFLDAVPVVALVVGIGLAIAGLVAGVIELVTHWREVWTDIKNWAADAMNFLKSHLKIVAIFAPWLAIIIELATHWKTLWSGMKAAVSAFVGFFVGIPGTLAHVWSDVVSAIHAAWSDVANWVNSNVIQPVVNFFLGIPAAISGAWSDVVSAIHGAWSSVANWVSSNVIQPTVNFFVAIPGTIAHVWSDVVSAIHAAWSSVANWVSSNVIQPVVNFFTSIPSGIAAVWSDVVSAIHAAWSSIANWVSSNVIQPVVNFFTGLPGQAASALSNFVSTVFGSLTSAPQWILNNVIMPIVNFFQSIPSRIGNLGASILGDITGGLGSVASGALHAIGLATGGYVTRPTLALVGEAGPEYVIPESLLKSQFSAGISSLPSIEPLNPSPVSAPVSAIGSSTVLQVTSPIQIDGQTLGQTVTQYLLRNARSQGNVLGQWAGGSQTSSAAILNRNSVQR